MTETKLIKTMLSEHVLCTMKENDSTYTIYNPLEVLENKKGELSVRPYLLAAMDSAVELHKTNVLYITNPNEESVKQYDKFIDFIKNNNTL